MIKITPDNNQKNPEIGEEQVVSDDLKEIKPPVLDSAETIIEQVEIQNVEETKKTTQNIFQGKTYRITILTERLIRLEYHSEGKFLDAFTQQVINRTFPKVELTLEEDERRISITTKYFKLNYVKEKPFQGSRLAPFSNLEVKLLETDKSWYFNHPEARNFGTTGNGFDEKGKPLIDKGLYSTDGFASLDDSNTLIMNQQGLLERSTEKRTDLYLFMYKKDFGLCLKDYFTLTGNPQMVRRHVFGIWWNRNEIYNYQDIKELIQNFAKYKIPLTNLLFGEFWHLKDKDDLTKLKTGYTFNRNLFPDPKSFCESMHDKGIYVGLQINPSEGIMPHEDAYNTFANALGLSEQYVIPFSVLDKFTIINYFEHLLKPLNNIGIDFFWIEHQNIETINALNHYHYKNMEQTKEKRPMLMARNGGIATHRYPIHYSGETSVSWEALKRLPYYNSLAANKGISFWSHDVGGYKNGTEDSELYTRHVQLATFSPIFRFSSQKGHYYKREPWKWDARTLSITKSYTILRHQLIPYLYTEAYKYYSYGTPIVRPLYYSLPAIVDEPTYKNEYYLGSELLVAPITAPKNKDMNRAVEKIYLPKGIWYDFKTGKKFIGDKRYIIFYKDEDYPVFAKFGSVIVLTSKEENLNKMTNPKHFEVHVFPGQSNTYTLYEDDGISNLYKEGYYIKTAFDYNYLQNNYTLIIRPIEGKTGFIPEKRDYTIRFRNTRESENVTIYLDNKQIIFDSYVEDNDFILEIKDVLTTSQITINCKGKDIEIDAIRIINEEIDSIISDLHLTTRIKEKIASIMFSPISIDKKRIQIKKLKKIGVDKRFIKMFLKLLEYAAEL